MNKILSFFFLLCSNVLFGQQIIKNLQWLNVDLEIDELSYDSGLTLYANTENISDGEVVRIIILGKGNETDDVVGEYISRVHENKIVFHWTLLFEEEKLQNSLYEIRLQDSLYEIKGESFANPEYYFYIQYNTVKSHNSGLLKVRGYYKRRVINSLNGLPLINLKYTIICPDDTVLKGWTNAEGYIHHENLKYMGAAKFIFDYENDEEHEVDPAIQYAQKPIYYTVKKNDNLWKIASYKFIYGNPYLWKIIYEANKNNFIDNKNPNLIEIGQTLVIPSQKEETRIGTR